LYPDDSNLAECIGFVSSLCNLHRTAVQVSYPVSYLKCVLRKKPNQEQYALYYWFGINVFFVFLIYRYHLDSMIDSSKYSRFPFDIPHAVNLHPIDADLRIF
jgi:hypothetical protein